MCRTHRRYCTIGLHIPLQSHCSCVDQTTRSRNIVLLISNHFPVLARGTYRNAAPSVDREPGLERNGAAVRASPRAGRCLRSVVPGASGWAAKSTHTSVVAS